MLTFVGPASTDDTKLVIVTRRPNDKNEAASDGADGDEAVLRFGMGLVEDLEVVGPRCEELRSLLEGEAVLPPVLEVLGFIPCHPHTNSLRPVLALRQWL